MNNPQGHNSSSGNAREGAEATDGLLSGASTAVTPGAGPAQPGVAAGSSYQAAFPFQGQFTAEQHAAAQAAAAAAVMAGRGLPMLNASSPVPSSRQASYPDLPGSSPLPTLDVRNMISPANYPSLISPPAPVAFSPVAQGCAGRSTSPVATVAFSQPASLAAPVSPRAPVGSMSPSVQLLPPPPTSPPKPTRDQQPDYKKDWVLQSCQAEMKRRAELAGEKGVFRFGDKPEDVNRSISNVKKDTAALQLMAHDAWLASKGMDPAWKFAPQGTPEWRRIAHQAKAAAAAEEEREKKRSRTSADSARLAFIMFSDEIYPRLLLSENPPKDRNKRDLNQIGSCDPDGVWGDVVDYFLDENLELSGVSPGNPKSHADSSAPGVSRMWDVLKQLDYKEPVEKWKKEWTFTDGPRTGELDKDRARERIEGWWKDMRTEYRKAVKRIERSGNHAEHRWAFCDQKYYVMLMLDWYDLRGGDQANDHCKRYFDVQLNEENGEAFNSTKIEQDSTDSDEESNKAREFKRRKRVGKNSAAHRYKPEEAFVDLVKVFKATGRRLADSIAAVAECNKPDRVRDMMTASDHVDELEMKLRAAQEAGANAGTISRLEANLEVALAAWKAARRKAQEESEGRGGGDDPGDTADSCDD